MTDKVDSGKIATEKNPKELVFTRLELTPVVPESPTKELALIPPISRYCSSFPSNFRFRCF